jgi:hypothetical protein
MKVWLGVIGRACIEFVLILILVSFAAGAAIFIASPSGGSTGVYKSAIRAVLDLGPLAAILALFLAFFSFELRIQSRLAGWLGLLVLGALFLSFGIGLRRIPVLHEAAYSLSESSSDSLHLLPSGLALHRDRIGLLVDSFKGEEAIDAVAVDFDSDYPRLAYSPRAPVDPQTGTIDIQGRTYRATISAPRPVSLVPEASIFSGSWVWDRLASMDGKPLLLALAASGGFLLLALGFRFLCRISGWPLANALFAAAGLAGLVVLDATLSGGPVFDGIESLARRIGLPLHGSLLLAGLEGALGLVLGLVDLAGARRGRRRRRE